jgi:hypothetical protein
MLKDWSFSSFRGMPKELYKWQRGVRKLTTGCSLEPLICRESVNNAAMPDDNTESPSRATVHRLLTAFGLPLSTQPDHLLRALLAYFDLENSVENYWDKWSTKPRTSYTWNCKNSAAPDDDVSTTATTDWMCHTCNERRASPEPDSAV